MMLRKKLICVILMLLVVLSVSQAGSKFDGWVVDDFDNYTSTAEMKASGGGPWHILQELQADIGIPIPPGTSYSIELVKDPNAFVAVGEVITEPNDYRAMECSYEISQNYISFDVLRFTDTLGIPFELVSYGSPFDPLPIVDMTKFDRVAIKIMMKPGNSTVRDAFSLSLIGPDTKLIGYYDASQDNGAFLEYPENIWKVVEFELNGEMATIKDPSAFDRTMVSAISFGISDNAGSSGTYIIDDVILYNRSVSCQRYSHADLTLDCVVDMKDFAIFAADWMKL